jgi:Leucine-rich repeat (LRR) protein
MVRSTSKKLKLSAFPNLWRAALGKVDDAKVLEGALSLEELMLCKRLDIAKTGWEWLGTLPKLKEFSMVQFELSSLVGITPNSAIEMLCIAYPRTFVSFKGIEVFSNINRLEIEGAKQISDLAPIGDLKRLRQLSIISSAKPKSWEFLKKLPNLEWAAFDGDTVWENGEFTKKSLKLVST